MSFSSVTGRAGLFLIQSRMLGIYGSGLGFLRDNARCIGVIGFLNSSH